MHHLASGMQRSFSDTKIAGCKITDKIANKEVRDTNSERKRTKRERKNVRKGKKRKR